MSRLSGGEINRDKIVSFRFNGKTYKGYEGDTLASALLANDIKVVARSFKYHRPRGIFSSGSEEPNALITIGSGAEQEPNCRATTVELYDGLEAFSQNHIGPLNFDFMAINDFMSPFLAAGFYYKTFMWPKAFWEKLYEPAIRRAAGLGELSMLPDPSKYDRGYLHPDLLIIGGGAAGLMAALVAGRSGAHVVLCDEDYHLGGRLISDDIILDEMPARDWVRAVGEELEALSNVRIMSRTTVFGTYDHGVYGAVERSALAPAERGNSVAQTLWRISAKHCILASGATEGHIPFQNNDRPGIMSSGALRAFANRWAVTPVAHSENLIAIFTNNDDGHRTALNLKRKGLNLSFVIDVRDTAESLGDYETLSGACVRNSRGRLGLKQIEISSGGKSRWINCSALGVSGGWNPNLHLTSHHRGKPIWDEKLSTFVPGSGMPKNMIVAGAAKGNGSTSLALNDGMEAAGKVLKQLGLKAKNAALPHTENEVSERTAFWHVDGPGRAWVDFQNDVTVKDIKLAHQENMRSVEHLKRWTTLGMAPDQGKTSNVTALAIMAELTGQSIPQTGTTIFRPPYTPVSLGVLGGGDTGPHFKPRRLTPSHEWAKAQGVEFVEVGQWMRAQYFPQEGETHWRQSVDREAKAVRDSVGICDVTTLGKIDVQGRDAAEFLNRIYANMMGSLKIGKVRYGLMLREDGILYDDGTCARLDEHHFVVTTTTANAGLVYNRMEFARQCLWPELDVHLISTTDEWAQFAVAGPNSAKLLKRIVDDFDLSNEAFPFMSCDALTICEGVPARLFRISFSGELAYEIAVPARYGNSLMEHLITVGSDLGATPYGTEALGVLRIEKGHATAAELTGQTTATMLGMERMVSKKKDSIGSVMSRREGLAEETKRLVGLKSVRNQQQAKAGSHLFNQGEVQSMKTDLGWVTSSCYSPHLDSYIALGFLEEGDSRMGEVIMASNPLEGEEVAVEVVSAHFIDPEGERLRG